MTNDNIFTRMSKREQLRKAAEERRKAKPQIHGTQEHSARDLAIKKALENKEKNKTKGS